MERLVAIRCPTLLVEGDRGEEARAFRRVLAGAEAFCPWVQPVQLGVCTMPARGPARFFGGEEALVALVATALADVVDQVQVGVADGLFAALLAAGHGALVPVGGAAAFLAPWPLSVLGRDELAVTLERLGVRTLGQFAALPARHVLARFGADAVACHRVAAGADGELPGLRQPGLARRLQQVGGPPADEAARQPGFFGGATAADRRAARAFAVVQEHLGPDAVLVGRLEGGRSPAERARLTPWGSPAIAGAPHSPAPWPGRIPAPSPVQVLAEPRPAELLDAAGRPVRVGGRGLLGAVPDRLSLDGGAPVAVAGWAGPWPSTERWWSARRHRARLQLALADGPAVLVVAERERWWLEAVYD